MSRLVFLDAAPLGMVSNPKNTPVCQTCKDWLNSPSSNLFCVGLLGQGPSAIQR